MKLLANLLTVLFVGLKLGNVIDWSWLIVVSPFLIWTGFVLFLIICNAILQAYLESQKTDTEKFVDQIVKKAKKN